VNVDSQDGVITKAAVFSDSLFPDMVDALQTSLLGTQYSPDGIRAAVLKTKEILTPDHPLYTAMDDVAAWLVDVI